MKYGLERLLGGMLRLETTIAIVTFLLMAGALAADVIGRELFGRGIFGSVKFAVYALIYCAMAGFGIATATGSHLRPSFADRLIPAALTPAAIRIGNLASAAILLMLAYAGYEFVEFARMIEERSDTLDWLMWPIQAAIPIGFGFSALRYVIYAAYPVLRPEDKGIAE